MPGKRSKEKLVNAAGTELKAVRLELTADSHQELRVEAAKHGMSMSAFVRRMVEDHLSKIRGEE